MSEHVNRFRSIALFVALAVSLCLGRNARAQTGVVGPAPKRILVIYDEDRHDYPGLAYFDDALRESFRSELGTSVDVFSESLNLSQFERPGYDLALVDFFRRKYQGWTPDLIIAVLETSLDFLLQHGDALFPGVPIVFGGVDASTIKSKTLPDRVTGLLMKRAFSPTLDVVLQLQPETRQVFVVGGASTFDRYLQTLVRRDLQPYAGRVDITYLFGLSMEEWLKRLSSLPANSVILYVTVLADSTGRSFVPHEALSSIVAVANAPTYVFLDQYLGLGVVGGNVYSNGTHGTLVAALGLQIVRGAAPASLPMREVGSQTNLFDARQLARWNLDEARLPPWSVVRYRDPSVWQVYRWYIIGGIAALVIEGALIGALSLAVIGLRRAERDMRQLFVRLATVEDDERRTLHAELHDRVGANLSALRIELDVAASLLARNEGSSAQRHLASAREVATETTAMARDLMAELRPPALDDYGLVAALRTFAEMHSARLTLPIQVTGKDLSPRPGRLVEGALFRIAHEAMINVARHASASRVVVDVGQEDGRVRLTVTDDGTGFDPDAPSQGPDHWGLKNMRERARAVGGVLSIDSPPGAGTRVTAIAPFEAA